MRLRILMLVLCILVYFSVASANAEPLTSGDANDDDPCSWNWVICNNDREVTRIDLGDKNISGQLVAQLGSLSNLRYLGLYGNKISGKIPPELGNLTKLEWLELHQNNLSGPIPGELGKLSTLRFLYLNDNILSGKIPMSLTHLYSLQVLNLANNNLSGSFPLNGSFSLFTPMSFRGNPYLKSTINGSLPTMTLPEEVEKGNGSDGATVAIAASISASVAFLLGAVVTVLVWWLCRRNKNKDQEHFFDLPAEDDPEIQLGVLYWYSPKSLYRYTLTDLQLATDNFNPENIIGRGGFGQVYKGFLADGSLVAVKRLKDVGNKMEELQFQTEVEMISLVVHPNLLHLQGFCMTLTEKLLVYPFMANGSLASCLQGDKPLLDWGKRKQIALGSAKGLAYLHHQFDPKVIHRDVKAANVLLNDKFEAVVGDFGLVKLMGFEDSHLITGVCGTIGYIAPEYYLNGRCSEKTDVFGYGVMLLELLSGQKATDLAKIAIEDSGFMLHDWVKGLLKDKKLERLVDGNLKGDYIEVEVEQLVQVALLSTNKFEMQRPTMNEVVRMLQGDGLAKRWQNQEAFHQESDHNPHPNGTWIVDSTSRLRPDILSGPR